MTADTASESGRESLSGQATSQLQDAATNAQEKVGEVKAGRNKGCGRGSESTCRVARQSR